MSCELSKKLSDYDTCNTSMTILLPVYGIGDDKIYKDGKYFADVKEINGNEIIATINNGNRYMNGYEVRFIIKKK